MALHHLPQHSEQFFLKYGFMEEYVRLQILDHIKLKCHSFTVLWYAFCSITMLSSNGMWWAPQFTIYATASEHWIGRICSHGYICAIMGFLIHKLWANTVTKFIKMLCQLVTSTLKHHVANSIYFVVHTKQWYVARFQVLIYKLVSKCILTQIGFLNWLYIYDYNIMSFGQSK